MKQVVRAVVVLVVLFGGAISGTVFANANCGGGGGSGGGPFCRSCPQGLRSCYSVVSYVGSNCEVVVQTTCSGCGQYCAI